MKAIIWSILFIKLVIIQLGEGRKIQFVSRDNWLADQAEEHIENHHLPLSKVIIAHTATGNCSTFNTCASLVRSIQKYHTQSKHYGDIGYNFLIGGNGLVYEGRGWAKQGAHTKNHNSNSICIAFIGNFNTLSPTRMQLDAAQLLLEDGITTGVLNPDYKLFGHRQLTATESPGNTLYEIIKTWPHWCSIA